MSLLCKENFDLPGGAFETAIDTVTAGNGTVFQDGSYGYIKTYAAADAAFIVSADSFTPQEFFNRYVVFSIKWQLVSLPASSTISLLRIVQSAAQPIAGTTEPYCFRAFIYNNGWTYQTHWLYYNGADYSWKQSTVSWVTPWAASAYVRTISLNTWYTTTIIWDPASRTVHFDNGVQTATSGAFTVSADPLWVVIGDSRTDFAYGELTLDYINVNDITARSHFTTLNCITSAFKKSPILTILNDLTSQVRQSFIIKNSILDYTPFRQEFTALNNIGIEGQLIYLDGAWVTRDIKGKQIDNRATIYLDGFDVSSKTTDWSIGYNDGMVVKNVSVIVNDRSYAQSITPRKYNDAAFDDPRIEIVDANGYSLGEFLVENKVENVASGQYSCTFSGRSMTALLDIPFSPKLSTLYTTETNKLTVVGDLASDKSLTTLWGIPDSILPAGCLAADYETPISVIQRVVNAGGGLVYTDRTDDLVCAYKDYETAGKTPVMALTSGDIISIAVERKVPDGENSIEVQGYQDLSVTDGWATISLKSDKYRLASNGYDSATITATVFNEDLTIPDVALVTDEEQKPDSNDHYQIAASQMIDPTQGVVTIKKKSDSSLVAGPYNIQTDGRTIRVGTAMADTTYQITYYGGPTVSFSVDQLADISPTEALIHAGKATATLRASAGGGGYATVSANYADAQTAKLSITIADPRVGAIELSASPSSVSTINASTRQSTITIFVTDSDGYAAQNGLTLQLFVVDQYLEPDYTGIISPATVTTATTTITEGTIDNPVNCTSETVVHTEHPITSLTSIYLYNGSWDTSKNYATGATVDGNQITLLTPLPSPLSQVQVTYTCTGSATATYTYNKDCPPASRYNFVRAFLGEWGQCSVTVEGPQSSGNPREPQGQSRKFYIEFAGTFTPIPGSNGQKSYTQSLHIPNQDWVLSTDPPESVITNGSIAGIQRNDTTDTIFFILTMQAKRDDQASDFIGWDGYVHGSRLVEDAVTKTPIDNASVIIHWKDDSGATQDEGPLYTGPDGYFSFYKGVPGLSANLSITKTGYDDLSSTIAIPSDLTASRSDIYKYLTCTFNVKIPCRWLI